MAVIDIMNKFRASEGWDNDTLLLIFADFVAEENLESEFEAYCSLRADHSDEYSVTENVPVYVGHLSRKHVVPRDIQSDIEISDWPAHAAFGGPNKNDVRTVPIINVPHDEFLWALFYLDDFTIPLKRTLLRNGNPTEFVLKGDTPGDLLFVDTQGYDYARYKASADIK
jgi:hypothetical protein